MYTSACSGFKPRTIGNVSQTDIPGVLGPNPEHALVYMLDIYHVSCSCPHVELKKTIYMLQLQYIALTLHLSRERKLSTFILSSYKIFLMLCTLSRSPLYSLQSLNIHLVIRLSDLHSIAHLGPTSCQIVSKILLQSWYYRFLR